MQIKALQKSVVSNKRLAIFSGGSGPRNLIPHLNKRFDPNKIHYLIANTDDGASSGILRQYFKEEELIGVGDYRNRILSLCSNSVLRNFLGKRLASNTEQSIDEWESLLFQTNPIFEQISQEKKAMINEGLLFLQKAISSKGQVFDFKGASIGNLILVGFIFKHAHKIDKAVADFCQLADVNQDLVLPTSLENGFNLLATLENGHTIYGQNAISHPLGENTQVNKECKLNLPAKISKIDTVKIKKEALTNELTKLAFAPMRQVANHKVLIALRNADAIVFSRGSLTSIIPAVLPEGIGAEIMKHQGKKIMLTNGSYDRETNKLSLSEYVGRIVLAANGNKPLESLHQVTQFVTDLIIPTNSPFDSPVEIRKLQNLGISVHHCDSFTRAPGKAYYIEEKLAKKIQEIIEV